MASTYELPFLIHPGMDQDALIRAIQRNFEHLAGMAGSVNRGFQTLGATIAQFDGALLDNVEDVSDYVADGAPPSASPDAVVEGGPGYLSVHWEAIENGSPVTYEVHLDTTTGFTPSASTLVAEVSGTRAFVRTDGAGAALEYDTDYFVQLIAKDVDGSAEAGVEGTAALVQITSPDLAVGSILAEHILAGSVTAEALEAVLVVSNLFKTAASGQRLEWDSDGFRAYGPDGEQTVSISTADDHWFRGTIEALGLDVLGNFTMRGANNVIDQGATITLRSKTANPAGQPAVAPEYDAFELEADDTIGFGSLSSLFYDSNGFGSTPTFFSVRNRDGRFYLQEFDAGDGSFLREDIRNSQTQIISGVARVGSYVYVLAARQNAAGILTYYLQQHNQSDLAFVDETSVSSSFFPGGVVGSTPHLTAYDADEVAVVIIDSNGDWVAHRYDDTLANTANTVIGTDTLLANFSRCHGAVQVTLGGTAYWAIAYSLGGLNTEVRHYRVSDAVHVSSWDFPAQAGNAIGLAHDGTSFFTPFGIDLTEYADEVFDGDLLWVRYQYEDASDNHTDASPLTTYLARNRAKHRVTSSEIPSNMDAVVFYVGTGPTVGGEPTLYEQLDITSKTGILPVPLATTTSMPAGASAGLSGDAAEFQTEDGSPLLRANGVSRFKATGGPAVTISAGSDQTLDLSTLVNAITADTDTYDDITNDRVTFPFTGQYLVICQVGFVASGTGRRDLLLQKASSPFSSWTDVIRASAVPNAGANQSVLVVDLVDATAGDKMRVRVFQNSGGNLNINQLRLIVEFKGPA